MTFLPIVERELRVTARRRQTYWTRFFAALTALALCTWIWGWLTEGQPAHERGYILFQVISGLAFAYSLLAGIHITADCISEEKREGTLGFLFLTDLKGYDVVLGKLSATSLGALYRLLSVFPILAIPILLGALTLGEFWRMALVLVNTLLFSLSAGVLVSSLALRERAAMMGTFLLIVLVTCGPPLVGLGVALKGQPPRVYPREYLLSSAAYPAVLAFDRAYSAQPQHFWAAVAATHGIAWTFLIMASVLVHRTWQDRPASGQRAVWQESWHSWRFGHGTVRAKRRRRLLDQNPVMWLSSRDRMRPMLLYGMLLGLGLAWSWLCWKHSRAMLEPTVYFLTAYLLHTILKFWLASEACRPLAEDRRSGALEVMLSTPLSVDRILEGQLAALERQFAWPVLIVLGADLVMLLAGLQTEASSDWLLLWLGLIVLFVVDLYTLAWVGFWLSLAAKKAHRAANGAIARVLVLPWAVFVLGLTLLVTMEAVLTSRWRDFAPGAGGLLFAAFAIAFLNDAVFFVWARTNLRQRFRVVATDRFDAPAETFRNSAATVTPKDPGWAVPAGTPP